MRIGSFQIKRKPGLRIDKRCISAELDLVNADGFPLFTAFRRL